VEVLFGQERSDCVEKKASALEEASVTAGECELLGGESFAGKVVGVAGGCGCEGGGAKGFDAGAQGDAGGAVGGDDVAHVEALVATVGVAVCGWGHFGGCGCGCGWGWGCGRVGSLFSEERRQIRWVCAVQHMNKCESTYREYSISRPGGILFFSTHNF